MAFVEIDISDLDIYEKIGEGAAGSVHKAKWKIEDPQIVAVKKLQKLEKEAPKEAEVLSSLSHRNIIQFYGVVIASPEYYLVTEYAELGSLYDYLRIHTIDFQQISIWANEIAMGMNYLRYEAPTPVIHRDLKSRNVVIAKGLIAKICDFGSSKFYDHTTYMLIAGTYNWMAPEIFHGKKISAACDVFSYGVILWEMLTCEAPFKGMIDSQIIWFVGNGKRLPVPDSCPSIFSDLINDCWLTNPKDRPTFKKILIILENVMTNDSLREETKKFLEKRDVWKREIANQLKSVLRTIKKEVLHKQSSDDETQSSDGSSGTEHTEETDSATSSPSVSNPLPPRPVTHECSILTILWHPAVLLFVLLIILFINPLEQIRAYLRHVESGSQVTDRCKLEDLYNFQIASKKYFWIQGDRSQLLNWERYGLKIGVSEGSLPSTETAEVTVITLVGGQFVFPKNMVLISAVYAVSVSRPLLKALRLEMQHCVNVTEKPGLSSHLKFAIAPISKPGLPHNFSIVDGGEFNETWYGSINRTEFCLVGIVGMRTKSNGGEQERKQKEDENGGGHHEEKEWQQQQERMGNKYEEEKDNDEEHKERKIEPLEPQKDVKEKALTTGVSESMTYFGIMYYKVKDEANIEITFIAPKNLNALMEYIIKKYHIPENKQIIDFSFGNSSDYIELMLENIPQNYSVTVQSHEARNETNRLYKESMDSFGELNATYPTPPKCVIVVHDSTVSNHYTIPLKGVQYPERLHVHFNRNTPITSVEWSILCAQLVITGCLIFHYRRFLLQYWISLISGFVLGVVICFLAIEYFHLGSYFDGILERWR